MEPVIYHGTPLTPRAALLEVCKGRAMCVSFFRPDDVEAVEAISPDVMFRQRRIFHVEGSAAGGRRMGREMGLDRLFRMARASFVSSGAMGRNSRYAGSAKPAERCATRPMAVWAERLAAVAHGRADRAAFATVREIRPRLFGVDRRGQASRPPGISRAHGGGCKSFGQPLACASHDAWDQSGVGLSFCQRGRHNPSAEWASV
jgi:hypothetical protein